MSKPTPGPWEINRVPGGRGVKRYVDPVGRYGSVAHVLAESGGSETAEANARLIASAPELLKAAKAMDALMDNLWEAVPWGDTFGLDVKALNEAPLALKNAIAKAEGDR